jgi:hypothetical protein
MKEAKIEEKRRLLTIKMKEWALENPFAAYIIFSNDDDSTKLKHTEDLFL